MTSVRELAHGKWRDILLHFGVDEKVLNKRHQACPLCEKGRDRFRFTDYKGNGEWYCNSCGSNDGFDLLMALTGWDFRTCATNVEEALGKVEWARTPEKPTQDVRRALNNIWRGSRPVRENDETHRYLNGRGLMVLPPTLRTHPGIVIAGQFYPVMLAMLRDVDGKPVTLHQTFIQGGQKAPIREPKRTMPPKGGEGATNGCAIRLFDTQSDILHLAEGVETACAVREMTTDGDVWATKDAHLMEVLRVPEHYRTVHIWGDRDASHTGQAAAESLAKRLYREGKEVHVHLPDRENSDWLSVLTGFTEKGKVVT